MVRTLVSVVVLGLSAIAFSASGQDIAPAPAPAPAPASSLVVIVGTPVDFAIVTEISSRTAKRGDKFEIRLTEPLKLGDQIIVPVGAVGMGEVVYAERSHGGGKAGELIIAARYIDYGGVHYPLRGFRVGISGQNNFGLAVVSSIVLPLGMFVMGGETVVPAGTPAHAMIASNVPVVTSTSTETTQ